MKQTKGKKSLQLPSSPLKSSNARLRGKKRINNHDGEEGYLGHCVEMAAEGIVDKRKKKARLDRLVKRKRSKGLELRVDSSEEDDEDEEKENKEEGGMSVVDKERKRNLRSSKKKQKTWTERVASSIPLEKLEESSYGIGRKRRSSGKRISLPTTTNSKTSGTISFKKVFRDPHSQANLHELQTKGLYLSLEVDFGKQILIGHVDLLLEALLDDVSEVVLDTSGDLVILQVSSVASTPTNQIPLRQPPENTTELTPLSVHGPLYNAYVSFLFAYLFSV